MFVIRSFVNRPNVRPESMVRVVFPKSALEIEEVLISKDDAIKASSSVLEASPVDHSVVLEESFKFQSTN